MATKIQSRHVRDAFLAQVPDMLNRLINYASGFDVKEDGTKGEYNGELAPDILLTLTTKALPMMSMEDDQDAFNAEEQKKVKRANTIEELMDLREEGLISDRQLTQYTNIMKTNYEITELAQLVAKLDEYEGKI